MGTSPDIIQHLSNLLLIECDTVVELSHYLKGTMWSSALTLLTPILHLTYHLTLKDTISVMICSGNGQTN